MDDSKLKSRRICAKHFKETAFANSNKNKLLHHHPDAVPLPWFEKSQSDMSSTDLNGNQYGEEIYVPNDIDLTATSQPDNTEPLQLPLNSTVDGVDEETLEQFNSDFTPLPNTSVLIEINKSSEIIASPTPRKRKLIKTVSSQRMRLKRNRSKIAFLSKKKHKPTLNYLLEQLQLYISGDTYTFVKMQLRHQQHCVWSDEEQNMALSIYYKSPSTYRFLRERGFKLPCVTLIQKWVNVYNVSPGFPTEVEQKLQKKADSLSNEERQCVLMFDEMSIKTSLDYDVKEDLIEGFEDLGPLGRTNNIANHALLFMLRGLKRQWKCPFAYFLSKNGTKKTPLALLIDLCLEKLFKMGFSIRVMVSDQGSTNSAAIKLLGISKDNPYYFFGEHKIHFLFDVPHLFKSIRNNFINHEIIVNGNVVSWEDIRSFYNVDKKSENGCRAAPKLSERHINPQSFQKMSVKLATQVFSQSVSRGMIAASKMGAIKSSSALNTAEFLGKMNDMFDCLNSKHHDDPTPMRRPLKATNPNILNFLEESIPYINSWKININQQNPPCFDGLILTIRSVLSLYKDLQLEDCKYLLTGRLNQDPIENMFGVLRQRGGYNSNPSAKQFRRNLQHAMSIRLMDAPDSANCEPDCDTTLEDPRSGSLSDECCEMAESCQENRAVVNEQEHIEQAVYGTGKQ